MVQLLRILSVLIPQSNDYHFRIINSFICYVYASTNSTIAIQVLSNTIQDIHYHTNDPSTRFVTSMSIH